MDIKTLIEQMKSIKSAVSSQKQTLVLGLSSSLNGGAAYGFIVSMDYHYFTPALGIVAGLLGGFGVAVKGFFSEKNYAKDIPLKDIAISILFGIIALFLGYALVYYFVKLPSSDLHGTIFSLPFERGTIYEFFMQTMKLEDITATVLGSISSLAIPIIFKEKIRALIKKLNISLPYSVSK